ncbi:MAG: hypothetical protein ACFFBD_27525 [Candidatus Hodarchaeota archaeon]
MKTGGKNRQNSFLEALRQIVLIYLIEAELARRERKNKIKVNKRISPKLKELHEELTLPWIKLTPVEIANTKTVQLKYYKTILEERLFLGTNSYPRNEILYQLRKLNARSVF